MKERVTITIDSHLLEKIDHEVNGTTVKNRSHAIELLLAKSLSRQSVNTAVILAGGKYEIELGRQTVPTFLLEIQGKPVIEHIVRMLKKQGITHIIMSVYHKKDDVMQHFGDGTNYGLTISYVEEEEPMGTAGALKLAAEHVTNTFIVCNADELKKVNVPEMLAFHRKQGTLATIALTTVTAPENYGVVLMNGSKVYQFVEKPTGKVPSNLINAGFYIFEPEVLSELPEGFGILEQDVFPKLAKKEELSGYVFFGEWKDMRTKEAYELAKKHYEEM